MPLKELNFDAGSHSKHIISITSLTFVAIASISLLLLARWQISQHEYFKVLASQRQRIYKVTSKRGDILDRNNVPLAYSEIVYDLYIAKNELNFAVKEKGETYDEFYQKIAKVLNKEPSWVKTKIEESAQVYLLLEKGLNFDQRNSLLDLRIDNNPNRILEGFHLEETEKRIYPNGQLASQVIGFIGKNEQGEPVARGGVEEYWSGDLAYREGKIEKEQDSLGNQILIGKYDPLKPKKGHDIQLTLDINIQKIVEEELEKNVKKYNATGGTVIIQNPKTGEIIAMANYPTFDPNKYYAVTDTSVYINKAISSTYEFGSVSKIFTASAGIDLRLIEPDTMLVEKHYGCVKVEIYDICTFGKAHGENITTTKMLMYSDNIGAMTVGFKLGKENLYNYLSRFGIGKMTNITLAGESSVYLTDWKKWSESDLATASFGQGVVSATPLQIISGVSAIPNGGKIAKPQIVSKLIDDNKTYKINPKIISQPITETSAEVMKSMLVKTFRNSSAIYYNPNMKNFMIGSKTGTASIPNENAKGYKDGFMNTSFVGFDATQDSKFIMIYKLENVSKSSINNVLRAWIDLFEKIRIPLGITTTAD